MRSLVMLKKYAGVAYHSTSQNTCTNETCLAPEANLARLRNEFEKLRESDDSAADGSWHLPGRAKNCLVREFRRELSGACGLRTTLRWQTTWRTRLSIICHRCLLAAMLLAAVLLGRQLALLSTQAL